MRHWLTHAIARLNSRLLLILLGAVTLGSCGPRDPEAIALQRLAAQGYSLSVGEFHRAAAAGDPQTLQLFLTSGTLVDVPMREGELEITALRVAIRHGHESAAACLLENGASLKKADSDPTTSLLELALRSGKETLVRSLLVQPDLAVPPLAPLLLQASRQGEVGLIEALLDHQPELALDACLLQAADSGRLGMTDFLLQHQAQPDAVDPETHQTALMRAAAQGHLPVMELLLAAGASRFLADREGHLAADLARRSGHEHAAARLWQPLTRFERELGPPPASDDTAPAAGWEISTAPALSQHPQSSFAPDLPRILSPLRHAIVGHHSGLVTPPPPRQRLELHTVRPAQLPFELASLDTETATIEEITEPQTQRSLSPGAAIGKTGWSVSQIRTGSGGILPDWLEGIVLVRQAGSGSQLALIPGASARFGPSCAVIHITGTDEFYEGHPGDVFRFTHSPAAFTLLKVQPRRMQIRDSAGDFWIDLKPAY